MSHKAWIELMKNVILTLRDMAVPEQHLVIMGSGGVGKTTLIVQVKNKIAEFLDKSFFFFFFSFFKILHSSLFKEDSSQNMNQLLRILTENK